jgi:AcrR family transcriptional regulator
MERTAPAAGGSNAGGRPPKAGRLASRARERVLTAAYDLFSRRGVRAVGVETIIAQAGVARMTFYRHFPSKDDLVLAFLEKREELWAHEWLENEVRSRAANPEDRLLAIFELFDEWFQRDDFEGCSFINVLCEKFGQGHPVREASIVHLDNIRVFLRGLAEDAGVADSDDFASRWQVLMEGSIVAAGAGDRFAARRARRMGALLLATERERDRQVG